MDAIMAPLSCTSWVNADAPQTAAPGTVSTPCFHRQRRARAAGRGDPGGATGDGGGEPRAVPGCQPCRGADHLPSADARTENCG